MDINSLITEHGYLALFFGCIAEGETFTLLAGVAAHQGLLNYDMVLLVAIIGAVVGDTTLFFLGRYWGEKILSRFSRYQAQIDKADSLIRKRPILFVIGVRFMYGLRIIGPLIIGTSHLKSGQFLLLNIIGSVCWALLFVSLGYLAGNLVAPWLNALDTHLKPLFVLAAVVLMVVALRVYFRQRGKKK
ncbi:MAG: Inner membrane protein YohD [Candidatus Erwinia impunctatus]|nr:Inner membrane protein YohD [Culicoides impunctatus]